MMPANAHARLGKLAGGAGERRIVDIGECKMAAPARQRGRDRPANSTGGAGDDRCPVFKLQKLSGPPSLQI
jgi:hypothetical protein